jgi:AcrR family transcriptional regulator
MFLGYAAQAMTDAAALRPKTSPRPRRTQAERRTQTRARILAAVVECIDEIGFQRTTAAEICQRSGLTWGAVQHHFGGKDGILAAALEDSFNRFARLLTDAFEEGASIEERIDLFIDRAWTHFASPHYRSTFEILLHSLGPDADDDEPLWQKEMIEAWNRVWRRLFPDVKLGRRRVVMLQHYTISVLSGLASMQVLAGRESGFAEQELELLKQTLSREFAKREK